MMAAFEGLPVLGGGDKGSAQDSAAAASLALRAAGGDEGTRRVAALRDLLRAIG
jgi:hypothetical protein